MFIISPRRSGKTYWSNELEKLRAENARLKAQLKAAQETPLPAPVPAVESAKYEILHLRRPSTFYTLCGETMRELSLRNNAEVEHLVSFAFPEQTKLRANESWCADCLD